MAKERGAKDQKQEKAAGDSLGVLRSGLHRLNVGTAAAAHLRTCWKLRMLSHTHTQRDASRMRRPLGFVVGVGQELQVDAVPDVW